MPYLKRDIYSHLSGQQYGKAGTEVGLIAEHGEVAIVKMSIGNLRFPVRREYLTDDPSNIDRKDYSPEVNKVPGKKQGKKILHTQTLF